MHPPGWLAAFVGTVALAVSGYAPAAPPATTQAAAPATQPVRYLGLGEEESTKFELGPFAGITKVSAVREVKRDELDRLLEKSDRYEFHGPWLYFAVDVGRDVRFPNAGPGQPISAWITVTQRYRFNTTRSDGGDARVELPTARVALVAAIALYKSGDSEGMRRVLSRPDARVVHLADRNKPEQLERMRSFGEFLERTEYHWSSPGEGVAVASFGPEHKAWHLRFVERDGRWLLDDVNGGD